MYCWPYLPTGSSLYHSFALRELIGFQVWTASTTCSHLKHIALGRGSSFGMSRISSVRNADKILVLDDGKIVGMGDHATLLQTNEVYQEINQSQGEGVLAQ